jgi:hypothetical protein
MATRSSQTTARGPWTFEACVTHDNGDERGDLWKEIWLESRKKQTNDEISWPLNLYKNCEDSLSSIQWLAFLRVGFICHTTDQYSGTRRVDHSLI